MKTPIGNNIIVKPDEMAAEHKGIFLPKLARKPNFKGTVVSVGKGSYQSPMMYQPGDYILYEAATPIDDELVLTAQKNIIGKFIY